uniref:Uncharacterized protein n=1 Tax=Steinernema glaseri TaxID=37863 RepID=A0A1I7YC80_9BILA
MVIRERRRRRRHQHLSRRLLEAVDLLEAIISHHHIIREQMELLQVLINQLQAANAAQLQQMEEVEQRVPDHQ